MSNEPKAEKGTLKRKLQLQAEIPALIRDIQDTTSISQQNVLAGILKMLTEEMDTYYNDEPG